MQPFLRRLKENVSNSLIFPLSKRNRQKSSLSWNLEIGKFSYYILIKHSLNSFSQIWRIA